MTHRVFFDPVARDEILDTARAIRESAPMSAPGWYEGIHNAIAALARWPTRCAPARENGRHPEALHEIQYKAYRVVFTVQDDTVRILHVRRMDWMTCHL